MLDISQAKPDILARLFELNVDIHSAWRHGELSDVLAHQLGAPLLFDLGSEDHSASATCSRHADRIASFGQLLTDPNPPVELLNLVKLFAKRNLVHKDSSLPHEVATVIYYAAIVAALLRCDARITQLNDRFLISGVAWALEQPWLENITRSLFEEAARHLQSQSDGAYAEAI